MWLLPRRSGLCGMGVGLMLSGAMLLAASGQGQNTAANFGPPTEDYRVARSHFQTKLLQQGPAPAAGVPLAAPAGAIQVDYSTNPLLKAWLGPVPDKPGTDHKQPAVLFLHGGFAIGDDDWAMAEPYRAAGFIVMMPVLRGENGQPGAYSMFYNEVKDALTAAEYLAHLPYVDPGHIYVAGHSVGGTLALLSAMTSNRFHAAASFSGSPDQMLWSKNQPQVIPFDPADKREFQMRSPIAFATSFKCPTRLFYGDKEAWCDALSQRTAALARQKKLDVVAVKVPGDHFSAVPEAMRQSIQFFQAK